MKQYRIVGRFVKDEKHHVIDSNKKWTLQDAEIRMNHIIMEQEGDKKRGYSIQGVGMFSLSTPFYSEYELVDIKIQEREVTPWKDIEE